MKGIICNMAGATQESLYYQWLTLIPTWIINNMPMFVWNWITYPFPNVNGTTVDVLERISNFIPHLIMDVDTYSYWD